MPEMEEERWFASTSRNLKGTYIRRLRLVSRKVRATVAHCRCQGLPTSRQETHTCGKRCVTTKTRSVVRKGRWLGPRIGFCTWRGVEKVEICGQARERVPRSCYGHGRWTIILGRILEDPREVRRRGVGSLVEVEHFCNMWIVQGQEAQDGLLYLWNARRPRARSKDGNGR